MAVAGVELTCRDIKNGRVYPAPSYAPSIYRVMLLDDGTFRVTDVITLKDRDGRPLNGMPLPLRTATTETPLDGRGKRLEQSLRGIDAEGLVRLSDGSFWVGEENAPSLAHFSADGRMIERHVPAGTEAEFAGAPYEDHRIAAGDHRQAPGQPRHRRHRDLARRDIFSISSCRTRWPIRTPRRSSRPATRACSSLSARP